MRLERRSDEFSLDGQLATVPAPDGRIRRTFCFGTKLDAQELAAAHRKAMRAGFKSHADWLRHLILKAP